MKMFRSVVIGIGTAIALMSQMASALDEITVAYFLEWPMPFEYAKVNGTLRRGAWSQGQLGKF